MANPRFPVCNRTDFFYQRIECCSSVVCCSPITHYVSFHGHTQILDIILKALISKFSFHVTVATWKPSSLWHVNYGYVTK